jgi:tripartite-type tricarboxylate transporter receptor subunit TctC
LPREVIERLSRDLNEVLKSDELKKLLATDGLEPAGGKPRGLRGPHQERSRALEGRRREGEGEVD